MSIPQVGDVRRSPDGKVIAVKRGDWDCSWRGTNGYDYDDEDVADWVPLVPADSMDSLLERLRAVQPVGAQWRIVLGPPGAPEYWPLAPNTSAFQVAHLLAEARRTWPDAQAESCAVGRWRQIDPATGAAAAEPAPMGESPRNHRPPYPYEARQWMDEGARVECFSGKDPSHVVHEGWITGMTEAPTVRVQKDDGQIISWVLGITRRQPEPAAPQATPQPAPSEGDGHG